MGIPEEEIWVKGGKEEPSEGGKGLDGKHEDGSSDEKDAFFDPEVRTVETSGEGSSLPSHEG